MGHSDKKSDNLRKDVENVRLDMADLRRQMEEVVAGKTQLAEAIGKAVGHILGQLNELRNVVSGISTVNQALANLSPGGREAVQVEADRLVREEAAMALQVAITEGQLVPMPSVSKESVIIGRLFDADGNLVPPGRVQEPFGRLTAEVRDQVLGQSSGFEVANDKGKLIIDEIYGPPVSADQAAEVLNDEINSNVSEGV